MRKGLVLLSLRVALVCMLSPTAYAKQHIEVNRAYEGTWSSVVRFVRIDLNAPIKDRDPEAGYIMFEYHTDEGKPAPGSFELIKSSSGVKITLSIPAVPGYVERMLLDKLKRKLNEDQPELPKPPKESRDNKETKKESEKDAGPSN